MSLNTYVIDDDEAVRQSLTFRLREACGRARGFATAEAFLEQLDPDQRGCVVTDVRMPGMNGIELIGRLKALGARMEVVVISGHADVGLAVDAMKAGAVDFLEKPLTGDLIVEAVARCLKSVETVDGMMMQAKAIQRRVDLLTPREAQICERVVAGLSNKEIGLALGLSPRTIEIHRAHVMQKMRADSLSDLVRMMIAIQTAGSQGYYQRLVEAA